MISWADNWLPGPVIYNKQGQPWAVIEHTPQHNSGTNDDTSSGQWTISNLATLRRNRHSCVLEAPFNTIRVRCLSHEAAQFLARCVTSTTPKNSAEHALVRHTSPSGLLSRCIHGIPPPHTNNDPTVWWTAEEANFWQCFALANETPQEHGVLWNGTRYSAFAPLRTNDEHQTAKTIQLAEKPTTPRAIPPSAPAFGTNTIDQQTLGRWLARFARIRTVEHIFLDEHHFETATRGMPEGGGLGALRLWLAIHRVHNFEPGLYAYNALDHSLRFITDEIQGILQQSTNSMRGIDGEPAGVTIISNRMDRLGAKYRKITLSLALQNAGACIAAAMVAGKPEHIRIRANGQIPAEQWLTATDIDPRVEAPIAAFAFGT